MNNGCFLVRFRNQKDYELAIEKGPWLLSETYLTVNRWFKGFNPWKATVKSTIVWVQLPDLPIEFFNVEAVTMIAELIGKPIRVDRATELGARGNYARVSVEVDLTKPLLSKYKVEGVTYIIQYEGLEDICGECGMYGQRSNKCSCKQMGEESVDALPVTPRAAPTVSQTEGRTYGEWMSVKKKAAWSKRRPENNGRMSPMRGGEPKENRFAVLGEEVEKVTTGRGLQVGDAEKAVHGNLNGRSKEGVTDSNGREATPVKEQTSAGKGGARTNPSVYPAAKERVQGEKGGERANIHYHNEKRNAGDGTSSHASDGANSHKTKNGGSKTPTKTNNSDGAGNRSTSGNK
ncbi:unnamed protein product [Linum tenue]|nr:unnamed protein product [Linum tenue]